MSEPGSAADALASSVGSGLHAQAVPAPSRRVGRRYHVHLPGGVYVLTTIVLVLGALNGQNNLLFALFGLAVGGLVVSGVLSGANLLGISIERLPPTNGGVGEPLFVRYRVRNRNWLLSAFALTIEELSVDAKGRRRRGGQNPQGPLHSELRAFVPYIPARGSVIVEARGLGLRRGVAELRRVRAVSTFPFGLTKKSVIFEQMHAVRIRPRPAPVRRGLLRAGGGDSPRGGRLRRWRGGEEFWALREFSPGDNLRSVAWRPTARVGHVLVRDTAQATATRFWIELDAAGGDTDAVERAISIVAGLFAQAHESGCPVGLRESGGAVLVPMRSGRSHVAEMLDALALWPGREGLRTGSEPGSPPLQQDRDPVITVSARGGDSDSTHLRAGDPAILVAEFSPFAAPPEARERE